MATRIVYEGVNGKYEGTLFGGIKFWVAQRVPTRGDIVAKIEDNGGKIVLLEKYADVLIADHAKKNAPPGSVSWKYIDDSVRLGTIANIDDYRIASTNPTPKPAKAGKLPFTNQDDQILVSWVRQHVHNHSGNKIYQDLEKQYPHHSWHSWRDRWVKRLALLHEKDLPAAPLQIPAPSGPRSVVMPEATTAAVPPATAAQRTASTAKGTPEGVQRPDAPRGRVRFTEEDDKLLTNHVLQRCRDGEKEKGAKIYMELAAKYPHHSAHSWRDRWVRHLSLREPEKSPDLSDSEESIWRGYRTRLDCQRTLASITSFQARANGYLTRRALAEESNDEIKSELDNSPLAPDQLSITNHRPPTSGETVTSRDDADGPPPHQRAAKTGVTPVLTKEEFRELFNHDRETTGANLVPWAQIGRHTVDFWILWSCVTRQPHHESRDWQVIAESLGYDWVAEPDMPRLVKETYEKHLLEFERAIQAFNGWDARECEVEGEDEGEDGEEESDDEEMVDEEHQDIDGEDEEEIASHGSRGGPAPSVDQDLFVSSPPLVGYKRTFKQAIRSSSISRVSSVSKRRRHNPDEEIPCTPESRLQLAGQEDDVSKMSSASRDTPSKRPRLVSRPQKQRAEPETQDFYFGGDVQQGRALEPETQNFESAMQDDGLDDDNEALSPSELRSGMEKASPRPKVLSSANRPLPTIEVDDGMSESSDEFETMSNLTPRPSNTSRPALNPVVTNASRPRRTLPASWSKGTQPASVAADISPPSPRRPAIVKERLSSSETPAPRPSVRNRSNGPPSTSSLTPRPPARRSAVHPQPGSSAQPNRSPNPESAKPQTFDPSPIINHFVAQGCPASLVSRAVKATTCRQANAAAVIESLARGDGIPRDIKGVWTERDDGRVRGIASWLDALGGVVPDKPSTPGASEEKVFWRLVEKHGVEGVLERRRFLKVWDSI
ncbi:hypothetical protein MFIFM68171_05866 [Madurella fahalii]|uniref:DNA-binding protein RAP1 n=1 Tax=Madurella fahalii TaxID=1157608 RepID=A0ABQ0GD39_9PEZI